MSARIVLISVNVVQGENGSGDRAKVTTTIDKHGVVVNRLKTGFVGEEMISVFPSHSINIGRLGPSRLNESKSVLFDSKVMSKLHATIKFEAESKDSGPKFILKDEHSRNGTYVNGYRLDPDKTAQIFTNDILQFGVDITKEAIEKRDGSSDGSASDCEFGNYLPSPSDSDSSNKFDECAGDTNTKTIKRSNSSKNTKVLYPCIVVKVKLILPDETEHKTRIGESLKFMVSDIMPVDESENIDYLQYIYDMITTQELQGQLTEETLNTVFDELTKVEAFIQLEVGCSDLNGDEDDGSLTEVESQLSDDESSEQIFDSAEFKIRARKIVGDEEMDMDERLEFIRNLKLELESLKEEKAVIKRECKQQAEQIERMRDGHLFEELKDKEREFTNLTQVYDEVLFHQTELSLAMHHMKEDNDNLNSHITWLKRYGCMMFAFLLVIIAYLWKPRYEFM